MFLGFFILGGPKSKSNFKEKRNKKNKNKKKLYKTSRVAALSFLTNNIQNDFEIERKYNTHTFRYYIHNCGSIINFLCKLNKLQ